MLLATGLRREELVALRWENVDKDFIHIESAIRSRSGKDLLVKEPKTDNSRRKLAMTDYLGKLLARWNEACGGIAEGYLFPSSVIPGSPVYPDTITNHTATIAKKIGVKINPRVIRHVFMTVNCVELGANNVVISRLVGHADDSIDAVYMDSVLRVKRETQTRYEEYLNLPYYFLESPDTLTGNRSFSSEKIEDHVQI